MFRFLVIIALGYLLYKKVLAPSLKDDSFKSAADIDDDAMVQDPFCKTYIPKRQAVYVRIDEKDFYFCSKACRDKFLAGYAK